MTSNSTLSVEVPGVGVKSGHSIAWARASNR